MAAGSLAAIFRFFRTCHRPPFRLSRVHENDIVSNGGLFVIFFIFIFISISFGRGG
jgi:hypothetical protein